MSADAKSAELSEDQKRALAKAVGFNEATTRVEKLSGGYSNITLLVVDEGAPGGTPGASGARELIVRTPPPGVSDLKKGAHDVIREARLLEKLRPSFPLCPKVHAIVDDASAIGVPFFAMERIKGRVLRTKPPKDMTLSADTMQTLSTDFIDALAKLHSIDVDKAGLGGIGRPDGYVQRQVDSWRERYEKSKTDEISDVERVSAWLRDNVPQGRPVRAAVVHNDYKYDNCVVDDAARIVGVLDWELATVGEPMTDLGTAIAYWVEATDDDAVRALPLGLTYLPGNLTRTQLVERYQQQTGRDVEDLVFHVVLASFRIAVILQQIYYRYAKGFTQDPRFATLGFGVAVIAAKASRILDAGRIDVA